jgi:hypothetical protein
MILIDFLLVTKDFKTVSMLLFRGCVFKGDYRLEIEVWKNEKKNKQ